jgi:hypothetical protein
VPHAVRTGKSKAAEPTASAATAPVKTAARVVRAFMVSKLLCET